MSKIVTIFGSSQPKENSPDYQLARQLGRLLAQAGFRVCNGGYGGIMEASARGAQEGGGKTIGVTCDEFSSITNPWIDEEIRMKSWRQRLFKLIDLGEAYVVLNGGTGTLCELATSWEMTNKKLLHRPVILLGNFWHQAVEFLKKNKEIKLNPSLQFAQTPQEAVKKIKKVL